MLSNSFRIFFSNDDMEVHREHILEHMHALMNMFFYICMICGLIGGQFEEIQHHKSEKDFMRASAQNSANRANYKKERLHRIESKLLLKRFSNQNLAIQVVGYGGGAKAKDIRGPSLFRVELEEKNEVLIDHVTTVETKKENLRNRVESVKAEIGKSKDWVSKQLKINIPSFANIKNGNPDA
ncbi:hypothetical protein Cgig2_016321 [Carnegiea gigantea]|uniref:Uncharacterized protein n=1 Tax=Carnegiea gigantea TaxID=171969 RepID=A0A9Q1Q4W6_9CARY|nr:hypothetical protein Cgig2_016321 [Carnegiea gigantea]